MMTDFWLHKHKYVFWSTPNFSHCNRLAALQNNMDFFFFLEDEMGTYSGKKNVSTCWIFRQGPTAALHSHRVFACGIMCLAFLQKLTGGCCLKVFMRRWRGPTWFKISPQSSAAAPLSAGTIANEVFHHFALVPSQQHKELCNQSSQCSWLRIKEELL